MLTTLVFCLFTPVISLSQIAQNDSISTILLIDSSGSMKATDPSFLRRNSAGLFIDLLSTGDEIGIIEFASTINIISHPIVINSYEDIKALKTNLKKITTGGNTRIDQAISKAIKMLEQSKNQYKSIVLLSDGALDIDGSATSKNSQLALNKLLSDTVKELQQKNIKVYTISLSDKSAGTESKNLQNKLMTGLAKNTGGTSSIARSPLELHKEFVDVIKSLTDPPEVYAIENDSYFEFQIDSNTRRVNIIADKRKAPSTALTLESPDKKYQTSVEGVISWDKSPETEIITLLNNPQQGRWKIIPAKDVKKIFIQIFADSDFKLSKPAIAGTKQASEKITLSTQFMQKNSANQNFRPASLPEDVKMFAKINTPNNKTTLIPVNKYDEKNYSINYVLPAEGSYQVIFFTTGSIERQTDQISFVAKPEPLDIPDLSLDQSVYALGETIRATVILKDPRLKLPEEPLTIKTPDGKVTVPGLKQKDNKLYAHFKLTPKSKRGEYLFMLEYYDLAGNLKQKEAVVYAVGEVSISTDELDFGTLTLEHKGEALLKIFSELEYTSLPLSLEVNKVSLDTNTIKDRDLWFSFKPDFMVKGKESEIPIYISLPDRIYKASGISQNKNTFKGKINLILYSKEREILAEKEMPITFKTSNHSDKIIFIIVIILILNVILLIIYLVLRKRRHLRPSK